MGELGYWSICKIMLLFLACQACTIAAYYNPRRSWENKQNPKENGESGWKASLVNTQHRMQSFRDLDGMERMKRTVASSTARAKGLDARARTAPYRGTTSRFSQATGPGRKLHDLHDSESFDSLVTNFIEGGGAYNMVFSIGTPPQTFEAIADTGSDLVWIQCNPCITVSSECYNSTVPGAFSPALSLSYALIGCTGVCNVLGAFLSECSPVCIYDYAYGSGETVGYFSQDVCTINTTSGTPATIPEFQFGCSLLSSFEFLTENISDGIVGLGRGPISFTSQISRYLGDSKIFSYCLVSESLNASSNSTGTSSIIFGEAAAKPLNSSALFSYTPLQTPYDVSIIPFYYVNLTGISVGGKDLKIPATAFELDTYGNGGTFFDSGTTITALTPEAYIPVLNAYQVALDYPVVNLYSSVELNLCFNITGYSKVSETVPRLTFHFADATFDLPFENTFAVIEVDDIGVNKNGSLTTTAFSVMCLVLQESGINIFGNFQQQNFQVIYDVENLRVGWLPADCSTA